MKRMISVLLLLALLLSVLPAGAAAQTARIPIYVGNPAVDYMAEEILQALELDKLSDKGKIMTVYDWIINNGERYEWDGKYRFDPVLVQQECQGSFYQDYQQALAEGRILLRQNWEDQSGFCGSDYYGYCLDATDQVAMQAYDMMLKMTGSCASFTSLLTVLLGHLGFDSRQFHGVFINMDGSEVEHTWNYVLIDGTWYWMDIRIDHAIGGGHRYFMIEDTEAWAKEHTWPSEQSDWLVENAHRLQALYTNAANAVTPESAPDLMPEISLVCSDWARDYMQSALSAGLIPAQLTQLDLSAPITRQEFAAVAVLLYESFMGFTVPRYDGQTPFSDTADQAVLQAYSLGFVNGMGDGTYAPESLLTRQQACTMLGRVYELASQGIVFGGSFLPQGTEQFSDQSEVMDYAKNYIGFFAGQAIVNGMGDGTFAPNGTMTREQALKIALLCAENL